MKIKKKNWGEGGSGWGGQVRCERRIGWWGVRVDMKAMLGVGGDVGFWRCEPRIEGIVQCTKKVLYNIKKIKKMWGGGEGQYLNPKYSLCL